MARPSRSGLEPAPNDLRILQALANTAAVGGHGEQLKDPRMLVQHLANLNLLDRAAELTAEDLERALAFRDGLRTLLLANSGAALPPQAVERLNQLVLPVPTRLGFDADGTARLEPAAGGFNEVLARWLAIVVRAQTDGVWRRLKLCVDGPCRQAFFDRSPSLTGRWCMRRCANRISARHQRRKKGIVQRPVAERASRTTPSKPKRG